MAVNLCCHARLSLSFPICETVFTLWLWLLGCWGWWHSRWWHSLEVVCWWLFYRVLLIVQVRVFPREFLWFPWKWRPRRLRIHCNHSFFVSFWKTRSARRGHGNHVDGGAFKPNHSNFSVIEDSSPSVVFTFFTLKNFGKCFPSLLFF